MMCPMDHRRLRPMTRPPGAPRILTADGTVGITWTQPSGNGRQVLTFTIYEQGSVLDVVPGDQLQWPYAPSPGLSYQVSATTSAGEGQRSAAVVAS